jgi:hypothetical protein
MDVELGIRFMEEHILREFGKRALRIFEPKIA